MASLRRTLWYLFVVLGIAVFGGALAVVFVPDLAAALPVEPAIEALGSDYLVVAGLAVVALFVLAVMLVARAASSVDEGSAPEPEFVEQVPVLGAEFDDLVERGLGIRATYFSDEPAAIREDLRERATRTLMRARGLAREDARSLVESGRWTDDPAASRFLATDATLPRSARIRAALRGETWLQYGARAAADETVAVSRGEATTTADSATADSTTAGGDASARPGSSGATGGAR